MEQWWSDSWQRKTKMLRIQSASVHFGTGGGLVTGRRKLKKCSENSLFQYNFFHHLGTEIRPLQ